MKVEISRRKFLQGSVALTVLGGTSLTGTDILAKSAEKERLSGNRTVPTVCEMCVNKGAALAEVEDGVVKKLDPNPHFPKSRNMLCARGVAGIKALYDPDRLKYPLLRVGKRGDGRYKKVTWNEAFGLFASGDYFNRFSSASRSAMMRSSDSRSERLSRLILL